MQDKHLHFGFFFSPPHYQTEPFHLDCEWLSFSSEGFSPEDPGVWDDASPAAISFTWLQARE